MLIVVFHLSVYVIVNVAETERITAIMTTNTAITINAVILRPLPC